jgi:hypothetical protein
MYFDLLPSRAFAILSLLRSEPSVVVPGLGVNAIPVRTEEAVSTSFPLGKTLLTFLTIKSGCTDRRAEPSGNLTKTLFILYCRMFGRGWTGLFGSSA